MLDFGITVSEIENLIAWLTSKKTEVIDAMNDYVDQAIASNPFGDDTSIATNFKTFADSVKSQEITDLETEFQQEIDKLQQTIGIMQEKEANSVGRIEEIQNVKKEIM